MGARIDPTSVVLFAAGSVVIALILCFVLRQHKHNDAAIKWLMASNMALLLAALGVLMRPLIGFQPASAMVLGGAFSGIWCAFFAVLKAEDRPLPFDICAGFAVLGVATHLVIMRSGGSLTALMISSSIINSALLVYICANVWAVIRSYGSKMAVLLCLPFGTLLMGYASRPVGLMFSGEEDHLLICTLIIIVAMSWSAVILELGLIALRERQAQLALRDALAKVKRASAARTRFLLSISHDLRTPLNAVIGLSELMKSEAIGPLPPAYSDHVTLIRKNGGDLMEMVSDLLAAASEGEHDLTDDSGAAITEAVSRKFSDQQNPDPDEMHTANTARRSA